MEWIPVNRTASTSWETKETDPERVEILAAADRLLSGRPKRSSGNLSVSQLAVEAGVKYWVVAQKHTDLRDHFQHLAVAARRAASVIHTDHDPLAQQRQKNAELTARCKSLERTVQQYALVINELTMENQRLASEHRPTGNVSAIRSTRKLVDRTQ